MRVRNAASSRFEGRTPSAHGRRRTTAIQACLLGTLLAAAACSDGDPTGPGEERPVQLPAQAGQLTRADLKPEGDVVESADGFHVKGQLHVDGAHGRTTFANADLDVRFAGDGSVRSISGSAHIPSPDPHVTFADPVRADIGWFAGRVLNQNADIGIPLREDTEYFVYHVSTAFEMRIATGETGEDAVRPLKVRAPIGGQILMIVDPSDPMYYVYGEHDLIGGAGIGWSRHARIPFIPRHPVEGLGAFEGRNTRTGSFTVLKVLTVTGQMVDNEMNELHLSLDDPFSSELRMDYQVGYNGEMALDLFLKDIAGLEIPIGEGSGGMRRQLSTRGEFHGHAYVNGMTTNDFSWWPTFIPARPASSLRTSGFLMSSGDFDITIAGQYGWDLPTGRQAMRGSFNLMPSAMTLTGEVQNADITWGLRGTVTKDATTVAYLPPQQILDGIRPALDAEVGRRVADADAAWNNLQDATKDYEFELSLRGIRSSLPAIVDAAKKQLANQIAAALRDHDGTIYEGQLRSHLYDADDTYYAQLDALKAAALNAHDNATTRKAIENALRAVAARRVFSTTFRYKVLGKTVKTVNINERIMSDANANKLITAANNVKYIGETSNRKLKMHQIYDAIPSKQIFERVRSQIADGTAQIPQLTEAGFVISHDKVGTFGVYAILGGTRHELGEIDPFDPADVIGAVSRVVVDGLIAY